MFLKIEWRPTSEGLLNYEYTGTSFTVIVLFAPSNTTDDAGFRWRIKWGFVLFFHLFISACPSGWLEWKTKTPTGRVANKKSGRALLRGGWHKENRPRRRSLPSWSVWLMTCASKPCSWTGETPQACRGGSRATRGKRGLARKSLTVIRICTTMSNH